MKRSKTLAVILLTASCASYGATTPAAKIPAAAAKIKMIKIPAGKFLMGASNIGNDAKFSKKNERPQRSVYLSTYSIGKYEVTRGEYRAFMNAGGYTNPAYWSKEGWSWKINTNRTEPDCWAAKQLWEEKKAFTQTDKHPVAGASYFEAEAFCNWAGGHLPTQAQWEKAACWNAARNHANIYPWGDKWDAEKCNNWGDHNAAGGGYHRRQTAPVGSYPSGASPYSCQDMAGNVHEWCMEWIFDNNRAAPSGCWSDTESLTRCASLSRSHPYNSGGNNSGFRLAR